MKLGYFLSSEEWGPQDLVAQAKKAEQAGFEGLWISDQSTSSGPQIGPEQDPFFEAYREHVLPRVR